MSMQTRKVWLITGASSGLGLALVHEILGQGHRVIATARDTAPVQNICKRYPGSALCLRLDIRNADEVRDVLRASNDRFGGIDVVVNNAGFGVFGAVEEVSFPQMEDQFQTNFFGTIGVIQSVLPYFRCQKHGTIINLSSVGAHFGVSGLGLYSATKAAIESVSRTLANEVAKFGVKVSVVIPGALSTRFAENMTTVSTLDCYDFIRQEWQGWNTKAVYSDLQRVSRAIFEVGCMDNPPGRVAIGPDALHFVREEHSEGLNICDQYEELSLLSPKLLASEMKVTA